MDADKEENKFTYGETHSMVKKIGYGLRNLGLKDGEVVLVFSPNQLLYPSTIYGIICAGGVFTGANPTYTSTELTHQLKHSGARFIIVDIALLKVAKEAAKMAGISDRNIVTFTDTQGHKSIKDITKSGKQLD